LSAVGDNYLELDRGGEDLRLTFDEAGDLVEASGGRSERWRLGGGPNHPASSLWLQTEQGKWFHYEARDPRLAQLAERVLGVTTEHLTLSRSRTARAILQAAGRHRAINIGSIAFRRAPGTLLDQSGRPRRLRPADRSWLTSLTHSRASRPPGPAGAPGATAR
jgi:hypothetical protein